MVDFGKNLRGYVQGIIAAADFKINTSLYLKVSTIKSSKLSDELMASETICTFSARRTRGRVFLVGSVLNQADDVSLAVRRLVFGEMKVCGITRADDATRAALEDFFRSRRRAREASPRAVTPRRTRGPLE